MSKHRRRFVALLAIGAALILVVSLQGRSGQAGMNSDKRSLVVNSVQRKVLIAGGFPGDLGPNYLPQRSTEIYDPSTNSFAPFDQTPLMNEPHYGPVAVLITGAGPDKVLIAVAHEILSRRL